MEKNERTQPGKKGDREMLGSRVMEFKLICRRQGGRNSEARDEKHTAFQRSCFNTSPHAQKTLSI